MFCSACGCKINEWANFCGRCGRLLEKSEVYDFGKEKCKLLRQIRKTIAQLNDIDITFEECNHEGLCLGTCPMCERELSLLDSEIERKKQKGDRVFMPEITVNKNYVFPSKRISTLDIPPAGIPAPISRFMSKNKVKKRFPWSK